MAIGMDQVKREIHYLFKVVAPLIVGLLTTAVLGIFGMAFQLVILSERVDTAIKRIDKNEAIIATVIQNQNEISNIDSRLDKVEQYIRR